MAGRKALSKSSKPRLSRSYTDTLDTLSTKSYNSACFTRPSLSPSYSATGRDSKWKVLTNNRVEIYDKDKKSKTLRFVQDVKHIQLVNRHFQIFALASQVYVYKNWTEIFDCLRTAPNERGTFACASFQGDEHRFILITIGEKSKCQVQIKDYVLARDFTIDEVFGDDE